MRIVKPTAYLLAALIAGWGIHGIITTQPPIANPPVPINNPGISTTQATAAVMATLAPQGH